MKKIFLLIFIVIFTSKSAYPAEHIKPVNILTWWGYLNYPNIINSAERECGVKISYDQYYSNDEFLRRWRERKNSYDIIIFSNTIYNGIKSEIPTLNKSNLWKQSYKYNSIIKKTYLAKKYPHNIIYFIHSLTGFMYNPKTIILSSSDSIFTIFRKSKSNVVVIIDDPVEAKKLLNIGFKNNNSKDILNIKKFKRLYQNSQVYIGNGFNQIYKQSNFAFAFTWSGEAIKQINSLNPNYKFIIHPKLSYISSDLLAQMNEYVNTQCVANFCLLKKHYK